MIILQDCKTELMFGYVDCSLEYLSANSSSVIFIATFHVVLVAETNLDWRNAD